MLCISSCKKTREEKLEDIILQWNEKQILFPKDPVFTIYGEQEVDYQIPQSDFKIIQYVDSLGCASCKLQIAKWKNFVTYLDSVTNQKVPCIFFFHPQRKRELKIELKKEHFDYPVCFDMDDEFNKLNKLPSDMLFQTMLLDKDNRVIAIGNPIYKPQIKDLYLNLIMGKKNKKEIDATKTIAAISSNEIDFGSFDWEMKQDSVIYLTNKGTAPLVIHDIETSCGCTVAEYDPAPVLPNKTIPVTVSFKADRPETFNKTIIIHCNTDKTPFVLHVKGRAVIANKNKM